MAAVAAGAAGTGVAVAAGAFGYNRENFKWDAENRWERFTSAREYANQQAEQYRGDLRNLAALTQKKSTVWCITSTLCMALCVALYCAGRLGLHGPSPPTWIMGLWLTNNAAAFSFMALCMFLSMHAGFRASSASVHLLTRKVRVPVPTLQQLDDARKFASEFEQQDLGDIFRIPYVTNNGAPRTDDAVYPSDGDGASPGGSSRRSSSAPSRKVGKDGKSSWIREEFETDRAGTVQASNRPYDDAPEHYKLYANVQKEYYQYDIYARVSIFYGFIHYVQSLAYYGLGHINVELRAFWVAYACAGVIAVLQALLLRFDIVPSNPNKKEYLPKCEYLGPIAILPAAIGMSLDFQVEFNLTAITICWIFVFIAYVLQLLYALRLFEICLPDEVVNKGEKLGSTFFPQGWDKIPSTFAHVFYFVAPPEKMQPGQHDIVREIKEGGQGAYEDITGQASPSSSPTGRPLLGPEPLPALFQASKHVEPWRCVARIAGVMPCLWVFLILGNIVDVIVGEQGLVTAPHWSRPPMTRPSRRPHELGTPLGGPLPAGDTPFTPEMMAWHEEKRHASQYNLGRRLQAGAPALDKQAFHTAINSLLAELPSADKAAAVKASPEKVSWPSFFEPRILACGPNTTATSSVAAITPRGFGSIARIGHGGHSQAETFRLSGLLGKPALMGATWGHNDDLLVVSKGGHLIPCPGPRPANGGVWACHAEDAGMPRLPVPEGARLHAATAAWLPGTAGIGGERRLHAAIVDDSAPHLVGLFAHESGSWLPMGELRVPGGGKKAKTSLAFAGGDIVVTTSDGQILRRRLRDGAITASGAHILGSRSAKRETEWQGACATEHGRVAHLHLERPSSTAAWRPEVMTAQQASGVDTVSMPAIYN